MKKTVYVHIGSYKTGTTAIQSFFAQNRDNLKKIGILYPGTKDAHHKIVWELQETDSFDNLAGNDTYILKILQEIKKTACNTIVLSSEVFSGTKNAEKLKLAFDRILGNSISIKIIIYVRRQDHIVQSAYQQQVKSKKSCICSTITDFLKSETGFPDKWDWDKKIKPWISVFGKEAIIVRVYEKDQFYQNDLIKDFLHILGLEYRDEFRLPAKEQSNVGLGPEAIEIMRIRNAEISDPEVKFFLKKILEKIGSKEIDKPYSLLPPRERYNILMVFQESNQKVAREHLGRKDGKLFYEPWPDPDEPWEPNEGLTVEKIVPLFTQMLYTIDKKNKVPLDSAQDKKTGNHGMRYIACIGKRVLLAFSRNNTQKKTLYIHIGSHKTGTTALQRFLSANRKILKHNGCIYPGQGFNHHDMVSEFRSRSLSDIVEDPDSTTMNYFYEIVRSGCEKIILSSEIFENAGMPVDSLKEFLDDRYQVKIICYVRRQDEKAESGYNEAVRDFQTQYDKPITEFIKILSESGHVDPQDPPLPEKRLVYSDYYSLLRPWSNAFGRENIIVRCYEEEQLPEGIFHDFLDTAGIAPDTRYRIPKRRINDSLDWDLIEFFRICNTRFKADNDFNRFILRFLRQIPPENPGKRPRLLSPEQRRDIISLFEESNARVAREYLDRSDGRLFFAPLPDPAEPWEPPEGLTIQKIIPVFLRMIYYVDTNHRQMIMGQTTKKGNRAYTRHIKRWIRAVLS